MKPSTAHSRDASEASSTGGPQIPPIPWSGCTQHLLAMGMAPDRAPNWWEESVALAGQPAGAAAQAAAGDPLRRAVYAELEGIERSTRARLLRHVARHASRQVVATLEAATLDLVAPMRDAARESLGRELQAEGQRRSSRALFQALSPLPDCAPASQRASLDRTPGLDRMPGPDPVANPGQVASAFARVAQGLDASPESWVAEIEVALAFEGTSAAALVRGRSTVSLGADAVKLGADAVPSKADQNGDPLLDPLEEPLFDPLSGQDASVGTPAIEFDPHVVDALARIDVVDAFVRGDHAVVQEALHHGPLALDRSASLGALRATLEQRMRSAVGGAAAVSKASTHRDEFGEPLSRGERRRIARFLSFAQQQGQHSGSSAALGATDDGDVA